MHAKSIPRQAPLSMGFYRKEYWSGLPCPLPGDFHNPGIEPVSLTCPALAGGFFTTSAPGKPKDASNQIITFSVEKRHEPGIQR